MSKATPKVNFKNFSEFGYKIYEEERWGKCPNLINMAIKGKFFSYDAGRKFDIGPVFSLIRVDGLVWQRVDELVRKYDVPIPEISPLVARVIHTDGDFEGIEEMLANKYKNRGGE